MSQFKCLFFFLCHGRHLDLHSFPTRRSSDLMRALFLKLLRRMITDLPDPSHTRSAKLRSRSEEHTSELQSRQYLVCRLLLEKKKINLSRRPAEAEIRWR